MISKARIYKKLTLFFYSLWIKHEGVDIPVGIPGNRDPNAKCEYYKPIKHKQGVYYPSTCNGDGHYLCKKCIYFTDDEAEE